MSKKKKYEVRRWVSFPAFYHVEASSPQEARKIANKNVQTYLKQIGLADSVHIDELDCSVSDLDDRLSTVLRGGEE